MEVKEPGSDFDSAFNCLLCYFGLGDREKMKRGFVRLLSLQLATHDEDDRYMNIHEDAQVQLFLDAVQDDPLRRCELKEKKKADTFVLTAAKLIAPGQCCVCVCVCVRVCACVCVSNHTQIQRHTFSLSLPPSLPPSPLVWCCGSD